MLQTLDELGLSGFPVFTAMNKVEGLTRPDGTSPTCEADLAALDIVNPAGGDIGAALVSALRGWGIDALLRRIARQLSWQPARAVAR